MKNVSSPSFIKMSYHSAERFFFYPKVDFNPMSRDEAKYCLHDLVPKICKCLEDLHKFGYSHRDVRLPNICFDANHCPVLIDLDFCCPVDELRFVDSDSVLYKFKEGWNGRNADFMWLVLWVLNDSLQDYHHMELDGDFKSDPFIFELIQYSEQSLMDSLVSKIEIKKGIEEVLKGRSI